MQTTTTQPTKPRPRKSVSRHPLFPVIVALWCGALLGLGSLAIPGWMIESVVLRLHVDSLVPAAAPPLGMTARLLVAMALFCLGAVIGLGVARALSSSFRTPVDRAQDEPADWAGEGAAAPTGDPVAEDRPRILDLNGLTGLEGLTAAADKSEPPLVPETLLTGLQIDAPQPDAWHQNGEPSPESAPEPPPEPMIPDWAVSFDPSSPFDSFADAPSAPAQQAETGPAMPVQEPAGQELAPADQAPPAPRNANPLGLVSPDAASKLKSTPIESLGVAELAERLALAISERRARASRAAALHAPLADSPLDATGSALTSGTGPCITARQMVTERPRGTESNGFGSLLDMPLPARGSRMGSPVSDDSDGETGESAEQPAGDSASPEAGSDMKLQSALAQLQRISGSV